MLLGVVGILYLPKILSKRWFTGNFWERNFCRQALAEDDFWVYHPSKVIHLRWSLWTQELPWVVSLPLLLSCAHFSSSRCVSFGVSSILLWLFLGCACRWGVGELLYVRSYVWFWDLDWQVRPSQYVHVLLSGCLSLLNAWMSVLVCDLEAGDEDCIRKLLISVMFNISPSFDWGFLCYEMLLESSCL
jgi:hypothetical protein